MLTTLNRLSPSEHYTEADISPRSWPNGKIPEREDWKQMAKSGFQDFRLKVGTLVENPVDLSLADIEGLAKAEEITMHHCIQGWTGIAKWGGLHMTSLVGLVRSKPEARVVAFFSFGGSLYGGAYYDTQNLENVLKAQCMLASEMNGKPLTEVYGAPLRLRLKTSLATRWANGLSGSNLSSRRRRSAWGKAARTKTMSTSTCSRISDDLSR